MRHKEPITFYLDRIKDATRDIAKSEEALECAETIVLRVNDADYFLRPAGVTEADDGGYTLRMYPLDGDGDHVTLRAHRGYVMILALNGPRLAPRSEERLRTWLFGATPTLNTETTYAVPSDVTGHLPNTTAATPARARNVFVVEHYAMLGELCALVDDLERDTAYVSSGPKIGYYRFSNGDWRRSKTSHLNYKGDKVIGIGVGTHGLGYDWTAVHTGESDVAVRRATSSSAAVQEKGTATSLPELYGRGRVFVVDYRYQLKHALNHGFDAQIDTCLARIGHNNGYYEYTVVAKKWLRVRTSALNYRDCAAVSVHVNRHTGESRVAGYGVCTGSPPTADAPWFPEKPRLAKKIGGVFLVHGVADLHLVQLRKRGFDPENDSVFTLIGTTTGRSGYFRYSPANAEWVHMPYSEHAGYRGQRVVSLLEDDPVIGVHTGMRLVHTWLGGAAEPDCARVFLVERHSDLDDIDADLTAVDIAYVKEGPRSGYYEQERSSATRVWGLVDTDHSYYVGRDVIYLNPKSARDGYLGTHTGDGAVSEWVI